MPADTPTMRMKMGRMNHAANPNHLRIRPNPHRPRVAHRGSGDSGRDVCDGLGHYQGRETGGEVREGDQIQETIDFIRKHEPLEGYFVGFSGGKDSIVTLDLVRQSGVKHETYYSMTLIDPPEVVEFIKKEYPDVVRLKPKMTFWQGCMKKRMPLRLTRWCCDVLKKGPAKIVPLNNRIMGIRAEESTRRASRGRISKLKKYMIYKPVFEWSSSDIWDYIRVRGLAYPRLYDEGFGRIGCIVCPFLSPAKMKKHKERWPGTYRLLDITLNKLWERDKEILLKQFFTYEEFLNWPNWKSKDERRQCQFDYKFDYKEQP